jgi:hypothetical protein
MVGKHYTGIFISIGKWRNIGILRFEGGQILTSLDEIEDQKGERGLAVIYAWLVSTLTGSLTNLGLA